MQLFTIGMATPWLCSPTFISCFFLIKGVLNISDTNKVAEKYSRLHIRVGRLCLEFVTRANGSRLWVQSFNSTSLFKFSIIFI
jgi:hypothetical protein